MLELVLGTAIITAIFLLGDFLHRLGVPIPAGVLGLLLFYGGLQAGVLKLRWVDKAARLLLRHMVLLFIPLTLGLMDMGKLISQHGWVICSSLVLSFLAVLLVTGLLADRLLASENDRTETETTR